ncbi:uncharacterized protein LOC124712527 [Schistocerca piceifrons]|uniref:uncharacterized protein LOC124712527 n=1 Tax=Schistocerca piceifrons TaxID=274613 RepID=UPI001F5F13A9|nr:uncharacterized protein LOC124712527 [Schistocerca piceifrons]
MAAHGLLVSLLLLFPVALVSMEQRAYSDSYLAAADQIIFNLLDQYHYTHGPGATPEATTPASPGPLSEGVNLLPRGPAGAGLPPPAGSAQSAGAAHRQKESAARKRLQELHGVLSGEARRQSVAKAEGFSDSMIRWLEGTSQLNAAEQLRAVLEKVLEKGEARRDASRRLVEDAVHLLEDPESDFSQEVATLQPLRYTQ